jgi:curved DNA-binding protein CbpA
MLFELNHGLFKYGVKDYHAILGIPITANAKDIRLRYLKIAYVLHPDTCRANTEEEKNRASEILSKLVNPAYENLSKDKSRRECQLVLSGTGRQLADDSYDIPIVTETAKKLYSETNNTEKLYLELIEKLATDQYQDLNSVEKKIALMSELNMVYLIVQKSPKKSYATSNVKPASSGIESTEANINHEEPVSSGRKATTDKKVSEQQDISIGSKRDISSGAKISKVEKLIQSAKQHQENSNFEQGIFDLREAVKIEPNNFQIHALLSQFYLKQGKLPYAKVHYKKAFELNAQDPFLKELKKELDGEKKKSSDKDGGKTPPKGTSKDNKTKDAKGAKDGKDTKDKKKEAPKIFGIPLW